MRKILIVAALFLLLPRAVRAQGMRTPQPEPVFQSEGRDPIVFASTCTTSQWTLVRSSDVIARSILMVAVDSNTATICLVPTGVGSSGATAPTGAAYSGCFPYTPGVELPAHNSGVTDYSKSAWWCRAQAGTQFIKGYWTRDHGDQGLVTSPVP